MALFREGRGAANTVSMSLGPAREQYRREVKPPHEGLARHVVAHVPPATAAVPNAERRGCALAGDLHPPANALVGCLVRNGVIADAHGYHRHGLVDVHSSSAAQAAVSEMSAASLAQDFARALDPILKRLFLSALLRHCQGLGATLDRDRCAVRRHLGNLGDGPSPAARASRGTARGALVRRRADLRQLRVLLPVRQW